MNIPLYNFDQRIKTQINDLNSNSTPKISTSNSKQLTIDFLKNVINLGSEHEYLTTDHIKSWISELFVHPESVKTIHLQKFSDDLRAIGYDYLLSSNDTEKAHKIDFILEAYKLFEQIQELSEDEKKILTIPLLQYLTAWCDFPPLILTSERVDNLSNCKNMNEVRSIIETEINKSGIYSFTHQILLPVQSSSESTQTEYQDLNGNITIIQ